MQIGLISDTHGLLRPEALQALQGSELILHAGDIGGPEILEALRAIAPVIAVRGNNDIEPWAQALPEHTTLELGGARVHMLHDLKTLRVDVAAERINAVIAGHSHKPLIESREGVLYINPGSPGPRRFSLPVSVAKMQVEQGRVEAALVVLG